MVLSFAKMHSLGNDFVILDATKYDLDVDNLPITYIANRNLGIGCDQVLIITSVILSDAFFSCRIFNADGSEAEQCVNGIRCLAKLLIDDYGLNVSTVLIKTASGINAIESYSDDCYAARISPPKFALSESDSPFFITDSYKLNLEKYLPRELARDHAQTLIYPVSIGNPHAVLLIPDIAKIEQNILGNLICKHPYFPSGTNVEFVQLIDERNLLVRIYERGVGLVLSCGSGACAAAAICRQLGMTDEEVSVHMLGGSLNITWSGSLSDYMVVSGLVKRVFNGTIKL